MSDGKTRELALLSAMTALVLGGKEAMNVLPNIHPVALLLLVCTLHFGKKALYVALAFSLTEIALYGVSSLFYLYAWPLLILAALPFRAERSRVFWTAFTALFGLCFGLCSALPYLLVGGFPAFLSYWVSGIPFDLLHAAGNAVLTFFLLRPLTHTLERLDQRNSR